MKRFGTNLYEEPLYRIVFSDSRTDLIGGKWPDGRCEYREVQRYPDIHAWVLEKWLPPEQYAGRREEYERQQLDPSSGLFTCGPYPSRGEYELVEVFPSEPSTAMVERKVWALYQSRGLTPGQRKRSIMDPLEKQEEARAARFDAIWDDSMGPFQKADAVVSFGPIGWRQGFKRGADMDVVTGNSAPLPTRDNYFGTMLPERAEQLKESNGSHPQ